MHPTLSHPQLVDLSLVILTAAGIPPGDARIVAEELAEANMVGHDSHGVMRLMQYLDLIRAGHVTPGAQAEVLVDEPTVIVIDGHFNLGQVTTRRALELGLAKAREAGTATVVIRNCNHIGRLGAYTQEAAQQGMVAMMAVNAPGPGAVAPFGGIERRLGTNPICIAAPGSGVPLVLDMTTSATAEGKLRVSRQKGEMVPEGLVIDGLGRPSCDPNVFYVDPPGAILPLGSPLMGHKGFGLSVMIDVLCGLLSGSGLCREDLPRGANGVWLQLYDIERFLPRSQYDAWMTTYWNWMKDCARAPGVDEILMPGEIEQRRRAERARTGVTIPAETWRQIRELATSLEVSVDRLAGEEVH